MSGTGGATSRAFSASSLVVRIGSIAVVAVFTVLSAKLLDPDERGRLVFLLQFGYLVGSLVIAGVERAIYADLRSLSVSPQSVWAVAAAVVLLPLVFLRGPTWIFSVAALPGMVASVALPRIAEAEAFRRGNVRMLLKARALPLVALAVSSLALVIGSVDRHEVWALAYVVSLSGTTALLFPTPTQRVASQDRVSVRPLVVADVSNAAVQRFDRVYMGLLQQNAALGSYSLVGSFAELAVLPGVVGAQLASHSSRRVRRGLLAVLVGGSAAGLVCVGLIGPWALDVVFGEEYAVSGLLWLLVCLAGLALLSQRLLVAELTRTARLTDVLRSDLASSIVAVALFIVLIPRYSATGAAAGTLVGYSAGSLVAATLIMGTRRPFSTKGGGTGNAW